VGPCREGREGGPQKGRTLKGKIWERRREGKGGRGRYEGQGRGSYPIVVFLTF